MSNLKVNTINDASGGSNAVLYGVAAPANSMGFRNRIINGNMVINQRGGTVTSPSGGVVYGIDRWRIVRFNDTTGTFTLQQSSTAPSGFTNSGLITVTAAQASVPSTGLYRLDQLIEGFNVADLGWGTASAQSVTMGFWVRSSVTGTYGGRLSNSAETRSYVFQYTVSVANTYEFKTITIPGDTTGTWLSDSGIGIGLSFDIGSGSSFEGTASSWNASNVVRASGNVRLINTNSATFYITGVQLEAGSVASPFERRDYGRELMMCQRYYYRISTSGATYQSFGLASPYNATQMRLDTIFPVTMRTAPSALDASAASSILYEKEAGYALSPTVIALGSQSNAFVGVSVGTIPSSTAGGAVYHTYSNGTPAYLGFSAEL